jgi:hypothetical protein
LGLRRPATASRRGDTGEGCETEIFGDEIGVLAQSIARILDMDDDGVMKQPSSRSSRAVATTG